MDIKEIEKTIKTVEYLSKKYLNVEVEIKRVTEDTVETLNTYTTIDGATITSVETYFKPLLKKVHKDLLELKYEKLAVDNL